jgi:hypothetical protein
MLRLFQAAKELLLAVKPVSSAKFRVASACRTETWMPVIELHPERASAPPTSLDRQRWHDDVALDGQQQVANPSRCVSTLEVFTCSHDVVF